MLGHRDAFGSLLGLKAHRGVSRRDPGLIRLARWIRNRRTSQPRSRLRDSEILERAAGWLPQWFRGVSVDPATLRVRRHAAELTVLPDLERSESSAEVTDEAEEALASGNARRRLRGLQRLSRDGDPDLVDWCALMLGDEAQMVRRKALEIVGRSEDGDPHLLLPFAQCSHQAVRKPLIGVHADCGTPTTRYASR